MPALTPPAEHNSALSPETFLEFVGQAAKAQRTLDEANSELRHVYKRAKKAGIDLSTFKCALAEIKIDPEQRAADQQTYARYMAWLGRPVGFQAELEIVVPSERARVSLDRVLWEQEGYDAALAKSEPDSNPHAVGSEAAQAWLTGHSHGVAFLNRLPTMEVAARKPRKGRQTAEARAAAAPGPTVQEEIAASIAAAA
jgi:hypothetical protein